MIKRILSELALASFLFLVIDGVWIGLVMREHFNEVVFKVQGSPLEPNILAAFICYIFLIGGLYYNVIYKIEKFDLKEIITSAAPFGLALYGTYDFTTAAIFKGWDLGTAFMDVIWGTFVCTVTSIAVVYFRSKFFDEEENVNEEGNNSRLS